MNKRRDVSKPASKGAGQKRVSEKIPVLKKEGMPQKQAVATALSMERSGRLGRHGAYRRANDKKSSKPMFEKD